MTAALLWLIFSANGINAALESAGLYETYTKQSTSRVLRLKGEK